MRTDVAFALAGLGGFNAHGAGFLAAASEHRVVPDLVTATSGQIIVLADIRVCSNRLTRRRSVDGGRRPRRRTA